MTDKTNLVLGGHEGDTLDDSRIELITDFLMGTLDAAQVEAVKLRLETDAEFRDYCAPLILAWSVPPKHEREPMSRAQLAKHWDDFTKRAGFIHQKRKVRRRRWLIFGLAFLALGASILAFKDQIRAAYTDRTQFHTLPYAAGWVRFGEGREVQFTPGAKIRVANKEDEASMLVKLSGTARFRTLRTDTNSLVPVFNSIGVSTAGGLAAALAGEFTVAARGDTTDLEAHHPSQRQFIGFVPVPTTAMLFASTRRGNPLTVREGQRARVVRGEKPQLLP